MGEVAHSRGDALVDEASEESFPASDPPASWSGMDRGGDGTPVDG